MRPPTASSIHPRSASRVHRGSSRHKRVRLRVTPKRLAGIVIYLPDYAYGSRRAHKTETRVMLAILPLLIGLAWMIAQEDKPATPPAETTFLFEEIPPEPATQSRPDPAPPIPTPHQDAPSVTPPPQFGLQEEQLSETGELSVATGNTLMTEADTVVKAPVEALPAVPFLVNQSPRILKGRAPEYPVRALERGLEATVIVIITIDTLGRVSHVDVERSGGRDFDPEVIRAVRGLVFQPPIRNGRPIPARFRQPYEFSLR